MKTYNNYLNEQYGSNEIVKKLTLKIISLININFGKIILNKNITLNNEIKTIDNIKFINDTINIYSSKNNGVNIDTKNIIIKQDKTNRNIYNIEINLFLNISQQEFTLKKLIDNEIEITISHELLHIIELIYSDEKSQSWLMNIELRKINNKYKNDKRWNDFSHLVYLTLEHELRAKVQEIDFIIKQSNLTDSSDVLDFLKNLKEYKIFEFITNIDKDIMIKRLKEDKNYNNILKDFNELFLKKNDNYELNLIKYMKTMKSKSKNILKKILKLTYQFENIIIDDTINKKINFKDYEK